MGVIRELEEDEDEREWIGKMGWKNSDGDRLWDYGVDEDVEDDYVVRERVVGDGDDDDDDVLFVELIWRRKVLVK